MVGRPVQISGWILSICQLLPVLPRSSLLLNRNSGKQRAHEDFRLLIGVLQAVDPSPTHVVRVTISWRGCKLPDRQEMSEQLYVRFLLIARACSAGNNQLAWPVDRCDSDGMKSL